MANRKVLAGLTGFLVVLVAVLGLGMDVMSMSTSTADDDSARPDFIEIDAIAKQQALEMPVAQFLHDRHTKALKDQGKDCTACHKTQKAQDGSEILSFKYMRTEEMDPAALKDLYHDGCIGCHSDNEDAGVTPTGPQAGECRSCHAQDSEYSAGQQPVELNNALHFKHWGSDAIPADKGYETNCGSCHHQPVEEGSEKLEYVKFEEESCSYCHTTPAQENVKLATVEAYHAQCVNCHYQQEQKKADKMGPSTCAGCHGKVEQAGYRESLKTMVSEMGGTLPRLPRKQPDAALLLPPLPDDAKKLNDHELAGLMPVAFNHVGHEEAVDACGACHHKSVQACDSCHAVTPTEKGGFVSLEQAMHQVDSEKSCIGCHAQKQEEPTCAGCHASIPTTVEPAKGSCASCHLTIAEPAASGSATLYSSNGTESAVTMGAAQAPQVTLPLPESKEAQEALAKRIVDARSTEQLMVSKEDIPEKVIIDDLVDKYKASELPHRQIVLKMMENMKDDTLANVFHATETTVCQSCHHNSPASKTPPACKSCHGVATVDSKPGRPGLKAAFHGQCMECHKQMELEKPKATDCVACHAKKD